MLSRAHELMSVHLSAAANALNPNTGAWSLARGHLLGVCACVLTLRALDDGAEDEDEEGVVAASEAPASASA